MNARSAEKILLVDDEAAIVETLALVMRKAGYEPRAATSAEDALAVIATWSPEVALVDIMLPKMKGSEFAAILKAACPDCRIFLFTGTPQSPAPGFEEATEAPGVFPIIRKPVLPAELLQMIAAGQPPD